jgi:uncharacterized protein HemY
MSEDRIQLLKEWITSDPSDPFLHYALALEIKKKGQLREYVQHLEKLISSFPSYLPAYYQLGQAYEENLNQTRALQVYKNGHLLARKQNDHKTAGEINEAITRLEEE